MLDQVGATDNTIFVLVSDNGASGEGGPNGSLNYMAYTNGIPAPSAAELVPRIDEIGGPTTNPMYGTGWAMASNTPLKRYKATTHAGGIRDPFVIAWPRRIGDTGSVRGQYHHVTDVVPTVLELLGIDAPETLDGIDQQPIEGTSMVPSLESGTAATTKTTQYFEVFGRRAIWHEGWKAVAFHAPGTSFDDDVWELYDTTTDFAEVRDLAGERPDRMKELVEQWWAVAERHGALPLDDRTMERFLVPKPRPITSRSRFVYYDRLRIPSYGSPDIKDVSYTITARVDCSGLDVAAGEADGVLVCCGDRFCGYSLFVNQGRLVHDYNAAGIHYVARSSGLLPSGPSVLQYRFDKTGPLTGIGTVEIDGGGEGSIELSRTLAMHISPVGLTVGYGPLSPVSAEYEAPFRFGGTLHELIFELRSDRASDARGAYVD